MANLTIGTVWKIRGKREIQLRFQTVSLKCCFMRTSIAQSHCSSALRKPLTDSGLSLDAFDKHVSSNFLSRSGIVR